MTGFFYRTFRLSEVPNGLTWDEGAEAQGAAAVLQGHLPLLSAGPAGQPAAVTAQQIHAYTEPLLTYLQAGALEMLGWSPFAVRLPTAFLSTLALAATYLTARRLFGWRVAWLATLLQALALWQIVMSRMAIRPATLMLFSALTLYWMVRWLRDGGGSRSAAACGFCAALGTYAYTSGRFLIVAVALCWLGAVLTTSVKRRLARQGAVSISIAGMTFAPLGIYFLRNPDTFSKRAGELSVFNSAYGPWLLNWLHSLKATVLMFSFEGEPGWDKNIAHLPMFNPIVSALFVAGLLLAVIRLTRPAYATALVWLVVMAVPLTLTIKDLPDWGRVSGIAPAVFLFPALAATEAWKHWRGTVWLLASAVLLAGVTYYQYFAVWEHSTVKAESFRPEVLQAGQAAIARLLGPNAPALVYYGAPDQYDAVAGFLALGLGIEHPALASRLVYYDASLTQVLPPAGSEGFVLSRGPAALTSLPTPTHMDHQAFEDAFVFLGYDLPQQAAPGDTVTLLAQWQPTRTGGSAVTLFAHLVNYDGQHMLEGLDQDGFPSSAWHGAETVQSSFPLTVPMAALPGAYWLEFGAYAPDGRRLHTTEGQDRLRLGPIVIASPSAAAAQPVAKLGEEVDVLPARLAVNGGELQIDLPFLPSRSLDTDYSIFVHVLDREGHLVAQSDGPPMGGAWPSRYWLPNMLVKETRRVSLPPSLPAGHYQVDAGLYRLDTGQRLTAFPPGPEPGSLALGDLTLP